MRIALGLEYDGSRFCGWQSQAPGCGVQDALEHALESIAGAPLRVVTAGRTDAGVHALGQVVHFDTPVERPLSAWVRGVNSELPAAVAVLWAQPVAVEFHARFSAVRRSYRYLLLNDPVRPALLAGRVGWFHLPLDIDAMREAARLLVGRRDFSAFRAAECQAKSPVKELYRAEVTRQGEFIQFDFCANAFLHHMVRNVVGCLVHVGKGARASAWLGEVLQGRDRRLAAPTFAADGLYFLGPHYDPKWGVPGPRARGTALGAAVPEREEA
ncbi:MAG TPA: tRNA pseudouridine(38-40) synthase TruA [Burkholderiales bacterium]|nr:tRNA pseudouridine(38-40) synthase TruA [Burkholderiales bacterium]